ncbi:aspartic peptidase A1 [Panus rudis PR-1116 ss-1]|nr:aspartic peptidase A1 [Panus rudis PR-1116 ss-1]
MQFSCSFSLLLATLLVFLSLTEAVPVKRTRSVTLPITRVHRARDDVHPHVFLQQHINRGLKRYARMTGREAPSDLELRENIHKRMFVPATGPGSRKTKGKRFDRHGMNYPASPTASALNNKVNKAGKNNAAKSKNKGAGNGAAGANSTAGTGAGFSPAALQALNDGGLTAAQPPTADNSLGLDVEANDVGYIATVQMGTPPRDFKVLMDSGSADLWVGSEQCQSEDGGDCGNHVFLGSQSSSSFVDTGKQFQVTYGSGEVAGNIITDNINVAGLALNKHTFGVATTESVDFSSNQTPFDGLMGLAQSTLSNQRVLTPVEALAKQGLITDAITSYKISRVADGKNDGEITFGGLDETKFDPNTLVTFDNVNKQGFWEGDMTVSVDGQDLGLKGRTAILDTGTTLIIAPQADATAVHQQIPGAKSDGQGGFTIPCTTTATVALTFGGQTFEINPQDMLFAPVDPTDLQGDCISGISSGNIGGANEWLVGDVFLKNAYFSTDVTKNTISLAKLV